MVRRDVKRCSPVLGNGIGIRPALQEELRHGHVLLFRRVEERSMSLFADEVHVDIPSEKLLHFNRLAMEGRPEEL